jgi:hypothetical protein
MLHVHIAEVTPKMTETPEDKFTDEVQQYLMFEGGVGEISHSLGWWKVLFLLLHHSTLLLSTTNSRFMPWVFQPLPVCPVTTFVYQQPVSWLNVPSQYLPGLEDVVEGRNSYGSSAI